MRKLAIFAAAFALATAIFVYLFASFHVIWIAAGCIVLVPILRFFGLRRLSIVALGTAMGFMWCVGYRQIWLKEACDMHMTEQTVSVRIMYEPYETTYGAAARCKLDGYQGVIYANKELLNAHTGDTVQCFVRIESFVQEKEALSDGTILRLYAKQPPRIIDGAPNLYETIRLWMHERIDTLYLQPEAGFVKALLTGDRYDFSFETTNMLSVCGLSHAVAVSGMHVSILLTVIAMLCGYQPRMMALLGVPAIILFVLMSGASPSVCRAAVMQIMLVCAPMVKRERDAITSFAAAAFLLLAQNPWCIADISFQLSFAAVLGLIIFSGPIQVRILSVRKKPGRLLRFIASMISATFSATIATIPLVLWYFEVVSIVAVLVNLLTLWAVTGIFTLGLCSCVLGELGFLAAWPASVLCRYVLGFCKLISSFPYAAAYLQSLPMVIWAALGYFLVVALFLFPRLSARWTGCIICFGFLVCCLYSRVHFMQPAWRLTVLDVGQGQCLVLRMEDYIAVIDCGGRNPPAAGEKAARYLHSAGVTHIDALILTHYDSDHAGGAAQFLSRVKTDYVFVPPVIEDNDIIKEIEQTSSEVHYVSSCLKIETAGGNITIYPPVSKENANNSGITILATAQEYDILITGDLDEKAEMQLLKSWDLPDVEILVAGHHGARTSTSLALLLKTRPEVAVISAGTDNPYGHPHRETVTKLQDMGVRIMRTDLQGDLNFVP